MIALLLPLIMWLQEGSLRTYQSRLGEKILRVELLIRHNSVQTALFSYQLHSESVATHAGSMGLLTEYGKSMLRPSLKNWQNLKPYS